MSWRRRTHLEDADALLVVCDLVGEVGVGEVLQEVRLHGQLLLLRVKEKECGNRVQRHADGDAVGDGDLGVVRVESESGFVLDGVDESHDGVLDVVGEVGSHEV